MIDPETLVTFVSFSLSDRPCDNSKSVRTVAPDVVEWYSHHFGTIVIVNHRHTEQKALTVQ